MATLTVQETSVSGLDPSYGTAAGGGDVFPNDGNTLLHVKNGGGGSINVTINSNYPNPPAGTAQDDPVVAVPAGEERMLGPYNQKGYNNASGQVEISYSGVTTVTVAAIKLPR